MTADFDEDEILCRFDKLVELGIVHYGHSTVVPFVHEDFPVPPPFSFPRTRKIRDTTDINLFLLAV